MASDNDTRMSDWTPEERERFVSVFEWLLKEDKKQNPEKYRKLPTGSEAVE